MSYGEGPVPPVAVVGIGMRLPGKVSTSEDLWSLIINKRDARAPIPATRWDANAWKNGHATDHGYFLDDDLKKFDSSMFSMGRAELESLDPRQKMLLEVVWECMENAGQKEWRGTRTGVFVGSFGQDWLELTARDPLMKSLFRIYNGMDFCMPNRISYEYNLSGPSVAIQAACASGLTVIHEACKALYSGDCKGVIAAGASILLSPLIVEVMTQQGVLSPNGSSCTFSAEGDGFARAEGVNAVYLKLLDDAIRDGDPIRGVIRGTALSANGKTNGMMLPDAKHQQKAIEAAYKAAGITDLTQTPFVECHGTGTPAGDPIEVRGVINAFGTEGEHGKPTYIGSIKPNLGHSEGASGISSLIKAILAVENEIIPPNIKFNNPNPLIPFDTARIIVPLEPTPFPACRATRVSINSFGIGGANAHVILDSATEFLRTYPGVPPPFPAPAPGSQTIWPRLVVVTSSNLTSLNQRVHDIKQYLDLRPRTVLNDVAYTLANRRSHLAYRSFAVVTHSQNEPFEFEKPQISPAKPPAPVFVFTGQGAQWGGMASDLLRIFPIFAEDIRTMDTALAKLGPAAPSWTLEKMIAAEGETKALFDKPEFSQPLCTAVQIGVMHFMQACGVQYTAVVGHSSGEIAAAYAAGGLTLQEAIVVSYLRGWAVKVEQAKLTGTKGGMAAVGLGKTEAEKYVRPGVVVACENSPQNVTLSGDKDVLDATLSEISKESVLVRRLKVDVAYHSHHMKNVGREYDTALSPQLAKSKKKLLVPFYSSVTLEKAGNSEIFDTAYWCKNLNSPVRFNGAVQNIISDNPDKDLVFCEIGPHSTLQAPLRQIFQAATKNRRSLGKSFLYIPTLLRNVPAKISLTKTAGHAFSLGIPVNFGIMTPPPTPTSKPLTDLPRYPWDHNVEFWLESRLSLALRFPKYPRHELLGSRGLEGTDLEPTWRNIIAPNDIPWAQDHVVGSDVILPCAGYITMVGEALRQLSGDDNAGYTLREVEIKSALILPDNRDIEVMTTARLVRPSTLGEPGSWYEFSISSYNGSSWIQLCSAKGRPGAEPGYPAKMPLQPTHKFSRKVSSEVWYEAFTHVGMVYGPKFQGMTALSAVPGELLGSSTINTYEEDISRKSWATYTQHPTTLDFVLQMGLFANVSGLPKLIKSATLPTAIDFVYVKPASNLKSLHTQATFEESQSKGKTLGWNSCRAVDPQTFETIIDVQRCRHAYFQVKSKSNNIGNGFDHVGAASLVWRPDIEFCKPEAAMKPLPDVYRPCKVLLEKIVALCILHSVDVMAIEKTKAGSNDITFLEPHLEKYIAWLSTAKTEMLSGTGSWSRLCPEAQHFASMSLEQRENEFSLVGEQIAAMSSHSSEMGVMVRLCRKLAENMYSLATGKTNSVEIMFSRTSESLVSLYDFLGNLLDFSEYFKLSGHANPGLRILEIGAGTGASSARVLQALVADNNNKPRYGEYTFTDVSSGFFEAARDRLKEYPNVKYKVLDISRDPAEQGFELGSYDLIVASNVIHATPNLNQTLTNTRALLRDDGRFYLQEIVGATSIVNFLAGVFSGWWLGEFDGRPNAPTVSVDRWHQELIAAGFSGAEDAVLDDNETLTYMANIVTRAVPVKNQAPVRKTATIIYAKEKPTFASSLSSSLAANGFGVSWEKLEDFASSSVTPSVVVSALDLECPFFVDLTSQKYALLMSVISNLSTPLIWLTCPAQVDVEDPHYAQIIGLGRNVRNELSKKFVTIELSSFDSASAKAVTKIADDLAVNSTTNVSSSHYDPDSEYFVKDGIIYTSRYETLMLADELAEQSGKRPLFTLVSGEVGSFNKPKWIEESVVLALAANNVEVDVQATSLNYKYHDVTLNGNSLEGSESHIGVEAAGIVSRVGTLVDNIQVGDRVVLVAAGALSSVKVVNKDLVVKIPDSLDFVQAATLPISYITAIHALSSLKSGQTVLIHSGSGSLGQAAIQVAQMLGATVFTTAGTEEKADFITSQFGIPPSRIFSSCDVSFAYGVLFATFGKGVDIVLNTLSGELLQASWGCVSPNGKMISMTRQSEQLPASAQDSSRALISLNMGLMISESPSEVNRLLNKTLDHFSHGHIKPITISEVFSAKDVSHGFSHIQANRHMGRVLLTFNSESLAACSSKKQQSITFSSFKTYLLAGGMGGLGKSIAMWMVEHGARKFIFLSRSAGTSEADKAFITELESQGCYVNAIASSITDATAVKKAVQSAPSRLGGIMQLSMTLFDAPLSSMTYEQWMNPQGPKVDGTWNLHNATVGTPLDFFVLFSSISSVPGNPGQANYSSAGTFIEAFAQYRQRQGLACSVVNIGAVQGVGYISRHKTVTSTIISTGQSLLQEQDVLDSVQVSIQRSFDGCGFSEPVGNDKNGSFLFSGQLITGLRSTRVTSNADSRVPWKRDIRTSIVQADEAIMIEQAYGFDDSETSGIATPNSTNDIDAPTTILRDLVREVSSDIQKLTAKATMDTLVHNIGRVLCCILLQPEDCLENGVTLMQMGLDSMVSIEVRNWWKRTFPGDISVLQIMNAVTTERLAQLAIEMLQKNAQAT